MKIRKKLNDDAKAHQIVQRFSQLNAVMREELAAALCGAVIQAHCHFGNRTRAKAFLVYARGKLDEWEKVYLIEGEPEAEGK